MVSICEFLIDEIESFKDTLENKAQRHAQVMENQKEELKDKTENEVKGQIKAFKHIPQQPSQSLISPSERVEEKHKFGFLPGCLLLSLDILSTCSL